MSAATHNTSPQPVARFELSDIVLVVGVLLSVLTIGLILVFAQDGTATTLGIVWGWVVEIAIWVYIFMFAV